MHDVGMVAELLLSYSEKILNNALLLPRLIPLQEMFLLLLL